MRQVSCACLALDHILGQVCMLAPRGLGLLGILVWLELVQGGRERGLGHSREWVLGRTLELVHSQGQVRSPVLVLALGRSQELKRILEPVRIQGQAQELGRTQVLEHSLEQVPVRTLAQAHNPALERNLGLARILELAHSQAQVHSQAWERSLPWASSLCRRNWPLCRLFQHSCLCR